MHCQKHDYYAVRSAEEAMALHAKICERDTDNVDEKDCEEAIGDILDKQWADEDSELPGTLRQWLSEAKAPGWLTGTE